MLILRPKQLTITKITIVTPKAFDYEETGRRLQSVESERRLATVSLLDPLGDAIDAEIVKMAGSVEAFIGE